MAYKRRRPMRARSSAKRRRFTKRTASRTRRRIRGTLVVRQPVHRFTRYCTQYGQWAQSHMTQVGISNLFQVDTGVWNEAFLGLAFRLDDLPNVSEWSTLYDSYRIRAVLLRIQLVNNPDAGVQQAVAVPTAASNVIYPRLLYAFDPDSIEAQTISQMKEIGVMKERILQPNRDIKILVRPRTRVAMQTPSATVFGLTPSRYNWLDMAQTDISHYGFKAVIDFNGLNVNVFTQNWFIKVEAKYYLEFKGIR